MSPEVESTTSPVRSVGTVSASESATVEGHGDVVASDNVSTCCGVGGHGTPDGRDDTRSYLGSSADGRVDGGGSSTLDSSSNSSRGSLCRG